MHQFIDADLRSRPVFGVWHTSSTSGSSSLTQIHGFAFTIWRSHNLYPHLSAALAPSACSWWIISLRLLALILCSNCSNTFNKVLTSTWRHIVKLLFANLEHHFSLLNMHHRWSKHFTSRYDPSTPLSTPTSPPHYLFAGTQHWFLNWRTGRFLTNNECEGCTVHQTLKNDYILRIKYVANPCKFKFFKKQWLKSRFHSWPNWPCYAMFDDLQPYLGQFHGQFKN